MSALVFQYLDYLLHKEKQIPLQLMEKWRKAALIISYASIFCTFALGVSAFSKYRMIYSSISEIIVNRKIFGR